MCIRDSGSHTLHQRIKRAQAYGACEAFDRLYRLAEPVFNPTTTEPRLGQIGIENERAIDKAGCYLEAT
jgi:hypothetical protein